MYNRLRKTVDYEYQIQDEKSTIKVLVSFSSIHCLPRENLRMKSNELNHKTTLYFATLWKERFNEP